MTAVRPQTLRTTLNSRNAAVGVTGTENRSSHLLHGHCQSSSVQVVVKTAKNVWFIKHTRHGARYAVAETYPAAQSDNINEDSSASGHTVSLELTAYTSPESGEMDCQLRASTFYSNASFNDGGKF